MPKHILRRMSTTTDPISPSLTWKAPPPPPPATGQLRIDRWVVRNTQAPVAAVGPSSSSRNVVVSLFDSEGSALGPWLKEGYNCVAYQHSDKPRDHRTRTYHGGTVTTCNLHDRLTLAAICERHAGTTVFACAMPPSKDLSVAGARHWKRKREQDPEFQERAVGLIKLIESVFLQWNCPYYISNPASSQLGKLLRAPNHTYQPFEFGGWLAPTNTHPLYPEFIPAQDAYTQHQGLWTGGGFRMPTPKPVTPTWKYFISKRKRDGRVLSRRMSPILYSSWNARGARLCTPRGFALALCVRLRGEGSVE